MIGTVGAAIVGGAFGLYKVYADGKTAREALKAEINKNEDESKIAWSEKSGRQAVTIDALYSTILELKEKVYTLDIKVTGLEGYKDFAVDRILSVETENAELKNQHAACMVEMHVLTTEKALWTVERHKLLEQLAAFSER